jgi:hypothetical protein
MQSRRGDNIFDLGSPFLIFKEVMGHNVKISELRQLSSYTSRSVCVGHLCLWLTSTPPSLCLPNMSVLDL